MHHRLFGTILALAVSSLTVSSARAALTNGFLDGTTEYLYNTTTAPNAKHNTHSHGSADSEYDDGSGGDPWDINYLGTDIDRSGGAAMFQFGVEGGHILSGSNFHNGSELFLGDIAINVVTPGETPLDPTFNADESSGWDYAVRLLSTDATTRRASFEVFAADEDSKWLGANIYGRPENGSQGHVTDTYRLEDGTSLGTFDGFYSENGADDNLLEGAFKLSLLSLFDERTGGKIITYLTMSCVNDEAIVHADVSPVPLPAAFWLFGTALVGFIGISRRTRV